LTDLCLFNEKILVSDEKGLVYIITFDQFTKEHRIILTFAAFDNVRVK